MGTNKRENKFTRFVKKLLGFVETLLTRLLNRLAAIQKDKLLHFITGTYLFMIAALFFQLWAALLIVAIVGAAKEIYYDKVLDKGTPELADFLYTLAGVNCILNIYSSMKLSVNLFDAIKFEDLLDENEYLRKVLIFGNGYWYIQTEDTSEIERLLNKNRIRYKIKQ